MASSRALMSNLRALKQRLEEPPVRVGGYRPKRSVYPREIIPPPGSSAIAPKPNPTHHFELADARLNYIAGTGSDAEVQRAESRVHDDHVQPSRRVLLERLADARTTYIIDGRSAFGAARPDTSESRVQVMHDSPGGVQVGGSVIMPPTDVNREYLKALAAERLEGISFERCSDADVRRVERTTAPTHAQAEASAREPSWEQACREKLGLTTTELGEDKHADVDALAVPEERRPSTGAPLRRLLGFLIRTLLRRWAGRLES